MASDPSAPSPTDGSVDANPDTSFGPALQDVDPAETAEWIDAIDYVLESKGTER